MIQASGADILYSSSLLNTIRDSDGALVLVIYDEILSHHIFFKSAGNYCIITIQYDVFQTDVNTSLYINTLNIFQYVLISYKNDNGVNEESDEPLLPGVRVIIIASSNGTSIVDLVIDENGKYESLI
ncbi:hypothetical protein ACTFIZ_004127 [Dictyostelium cf. discoideum]